MLESVMRPCPVGGTALSDKGGVVSPKHEGTGRRILIVVVGLVAAFSAFFALAAASPQAASAAPLYFIHLGDIWCWDAESGAVEVVEPAAGACIGDVSWSADGRALAWEVRTWEGGRKRSRVVFSRQSSSTGGFKDVWTFPDAASPAVSPDGRYLLFETRDGDRTSLTFFDSVGGQVPQPLPNACNGSWVVAAGGAALQVAFDREGEASSVGGFYLLDVATGQMGLATVPVPTPAEVQIGRWRPLSDISGRDLMVTHFGQDGRRRVVRAEDGSTVLDVTNADHFDYRWLHAPAGSAVPCVELAPLTLGRSDIYSVSGDAGPQNGSTETSVCLTLLDSSFGWNASFPAVSPFADLQPGGNYYEAAAILWTENVVGGFSDGTFRAGEPVKRAQFAKMLVGTVGMEVYAGLPVPAFPDVRGDVAGLYPAEYVSAARFGRLVSGYADGMFRPWDSISRAQMITMVVRAARTYLPGGLSDLPAGWTGATGGYRDPNHGNAVHLAEYSGLLTGIELWGWDPGRPAQRGEVAQVLFNLQRLRSPLVDPLDPPAFALGARALGAEVAPEPRIAEPIGNIVFDGDSLTAGSTATYPYPSQVMDGLRPDIYWVNLGIGGQKLWDMLQNGSEKVDSLYQAELGRNIVFIWGGTNDMRWWNHSPQAVYEHLRGYCLDRRAQGYTVITMTMIPRTDGAFPEGFEADRRGFNARVRAGWAEFADVLIDVGSDPLVGRAGCETNTRFFSSDRVHLNNTGLAQVAGRALMLLRRIDSIAAGATGG